MSKQCDQTEQPALLPLQRILQKLGYKADPSGEEDKILTRLTEEARQYVQRTQPNKWPPKPDKNIVQTKAETSELKTYLGWALNHKVFQKAIAAIMVLDSSRIEPIDSSLFDDVMHYVEEKGPDDVIPPQLLVSWAKCLQIKGDLHGAIRRLDAAKRLLVEHKASFPCQCEAERLQGDCLQLAGLTLNKMCCWKSAIQPLMESADTFRRGPAGEYRSEAIMVCMEMVAKCLCNITHGDYLELKEQLGFQHTDRFYQAYTMCTDSAGLAGSSQLLYIKAQNQAAESLLKYAAQQEDINTRNRYLQSIILEAQKSLQAHISLSDLERRERLFEFIHSIFLIFLALDFSDTPQDRQFADKLEEQARFLYAEYCRQLSKNDFLSDKIDIKECPDLKRIISSLREIFDLKLNLQNVTGGTATGKCKEITVGYEQSVPLRIQTDSCKQKLQQSCEQSENEKGDKKHQASPARRQEVGLPIDPEDYSIPLYDVPLTIFQDLCGCKSTGVQTHEKETQVISGDNLLHRANDKAEDMVPEGSNDSSMHGITKDFGYESSVALVDTFLTTQLPELEVNGSFELDSGIDSSCASADLSTCPSSDSNGVTTLQPASHADSVKKARLLKFNPVTGLWSSQTSMVYVGQPLQLEDKLKGNCRDALHVQFLHQDEVLGRYVGKRYRRQRPASQYLQDVTCQKTARFLVTLFNYALQDLRYDIQVIYVPVAHVQLLSRDGKESDWLNVEPYLEGDFIKLTNNLKFCNSQGRTLATALTHFTHSVSEGKLMLVDLQGWLPREGRGVVYLTDPQFHTNSPTSLSSCDMGARGMQAFWESVHPHCNAICHALGLKRPDNMPAAGSETVKQCTRL